MDFRVSALGWVRIAILDDFLKLLRYSGYKIKLCRYALVAVPLLE